MNRILLLLTSFPEAGFPRRSSQMSNEESISDKTLFSQAKDDLLGKLLSAGSGRKSRSVVNTLGTYSVF
jgi:hypothetical protein